MLYKLVPCLFYNGVIRCLSVPGSIVNKVVIEVGISAGFFCCVAEQPATGAHEGSFDGKAEMLRVTQRGPVLTVETVEEYSGIIVEVILNFQVNILFGFEFFRNHFVRSIKCGFEVIVCLEDVTVAVVIAKHANHAVVVGNGADTGVIARLEIVCLQANLRNTGLAVGSLRQGVVC